MIMCIEQRIVDLRHRSVKRFKKMFIRHHRDHLEEGEEQTVLETKSFQEIERIMNQEF
jgi:hypothetical protein